MFFSLIPLGMKPKPPCAVSGEIGSPNGMYFFIVVSVIMAVDFFREFLLGRSYIALTFLLLLAL